MACGVHFEAPNHAQTSFELTAIQKPYFLDPFRPTSGSDHPPTPWKDPPPRTQVSKSHFFGRFRPISTKTDKNHPLYGRFRFGSQTPKPPQIGPYFSGQNKNYKKKGLKTGGHNMRICACDKRPMRMKSAPEGGQDWRPRSGALPLCIGTARPHPQRSR